jgi:hypothetical protein
MFSGFESKFSQKPNFWQVLEQEKNKLQEKITTESLSEHNEIKENIMKKRVYTYEILENTSTKNKLLEIFANPEFANL